MLKISPMQRSLSFDINVTRPDLKIIAHEWRADAYIAKPFDMDDLLKLVAHTAR